MTARAMVISVVAKSNTGKTTLLESLIPRLKSHGVTIGILKHHRHLSSFDTPGKDTDRLAEAGADIVVGASPVQVATFRRENGSEDLEKVITRHFEGVDLVLTEGYKRGPYPKIEVHRSARSDELLCSPEETLALVTDRVWSLPIPQFGLDDTGGLAAFLVRWLSVKAAVDKGGDQRNGVDFGHSEHPLLGVPRLIVGGETDPPPVTQVPQNQDTAKNAY